MANPSVALTHLAIRDFRGIESLDLDFRGPDGAPNSLVVLAGPNGCGKTAVLEAALLAVGGEELLIGRSGSKAIRRSAIDYSIVAEFSTPLGAIGVEASSGGRTNESRFKAPFWYFSSWRAPELVGPIGVTAGRAEPRHRRNDANRLKNIKQQLVNAAAIENFAGPSEPVFPRYSEWIARINDAWREFYPASERGFQVRVVPDASPGTLGAFDVLLESADGPRLELSELSSGQLELFLFIASLVLNDQVHGLVFIDEPELHLDPQWHRPIIRALTRLQPLAQFIVATHSPEIYDAASSYERHFLVPADDPRARLWPLVSAN